ncbi:hypothetical protein G4X40_12220 [Rhodococcus sp. D2-41]|uniref:YciI family protein n=1 Tax=Speluncibacter jeojiensis TaxID=2710754 RepID=UPI0024105D95|nr:YciI family protein [Rhodococcus sp. D2-41]MDG3010915.1 hypothetical protein [Rhodococcus sp. D2-41]
MPLFAVDYTYLPDKAEARDRTRPEHRGWLAEQADHGILLTVGPYPDGSGVLLIISADGADAAAAMLARDPFARDGLIGGVRVTEWKPVIGAFAD